MFDQFKSAVLSFDAASGLTPELENQLLLGRDGAISCLYAPFEHVAANARVVFVGITPGRSQAELSLGAMKHALEAGCSDEEALRQAKLTASFSGTAMRNNMTAMLDRIGLHHRLGIAGSAELFEADGLAHFTSALRFPVLFEGENYNGRGADLLKSPFLRRMIDTWLAEEARQLSQALWLPLGKEPARAVAHLVARGILPADRVISGLPHPGTANNGRVAEFLGDARKRYALIRDQLTRRLETLSIEA